MGIFKGINNAKVTGGGEYFDKVGTYLAEIELVKAIDTQDHGVAFVAEHVIKESNNEDIPVGSRRNVFIAMKKPWAAANVREYLTAANGLSSHDAADAAAIAKQDWEAIAETAVGEDNPLAGNMVQVVVYPKLKKDKTMGTRTKYLPVKDESK